MKDLINRRCTQVNADFSKNLLAFIRFHLRLIFLCALCVFAGNFSFAQNLPHITQEQIDWLAQSAYFERIINSGNTEQKRDALSQIRNLKSAEASRIAIPALRDKSEIVRATAAQSVVFLPSDDAAQVLLPLLKDKSVLVRKEAAYALGKTRSPLAVLPLIAVLQQTLPRKKEQMETELEFHSAVAIALGEIGDVSAIDSLIKILQRNPKEEEEFLRRASARSIGQIAQIIQTQNPYIVTPEFFPPGKHKTMQFYKNLAESFPVFRVAANVLIQTLQNSGEFDDVRREAAFALGAIGDASAIPILQSKLSAEDYYLAEISKEALAKISNKLKE